MIRFSVKIRSWLVERKKKVGVTLKLGPKFLFIDLGVRFEVFTIKQCVRACVCVC